MNNLVKEVESILPKIINDWQTIHRNPELSFEEYKTSQYIIDRLSSLGIEYTIINKTSVVAVVSNNDPDFLNTIVLRADIDALPIVESMDIENRSDNGVMHACGHDVHTASLLGVAEVMAKEIKNHSATVIFIFQQGEEVLPGGAIKIIESGVLDKYNPKLVVGQHVEYNMNVGEYGVCEGLYMASGDEIHLSVEGTPGHAANPSITNNPIYPLAEMVLAIKGVEEFKPEGIPTIISIGKLTASGATNIISRIASCEGTFRTMNEEWRAKAKELMAESVTRIASKYEVKADLNIIKGYPMLSNNIDIACRAKSTLSEIGKVNDLSIRLTTEDFGEYSKVYPTLFYRLGVKSADCEIIYPPHTPQFRADSKALKYGVLGMLRLAIEFVKN